MRKLFSILLISAFLMNVVGHYGIYLWLHGKAASEIENDSYDKSRTITIKIPLTLPYPLQGGFERVTGDFEYQGEFYKLVEQKYENDTLHVVCLRNDEEKNAVKVLSDIVKQSTDQTPQPNQNTKVPGFLKDFCSAGEVAIPLRECLTSINPFSVIDITLCVRDYPVLTPPPDFNS